MARFVLSTHLRLFLFYRIYLLLSLPLTFLISSLTYFFSLIVVFVFLMTGSDLPRPLPGVYERDAWGQTSGVYPGGAGCRQRLVRFLRHEHVHHQPLQCVPIFPILCSKTNFRGRPRQRLAVKTSSKAVLNIRSRVQTVHSSARKVSMAF